MFANILDTLEIQSSISQRKNVLIQFGLYILEENILDIIMLVIVFEFHQYFSNIQINVSVRSGLYT